MSELKNKKASKCSLAARFIWIAIAAILVFIAFQCISLKTMRHSQREIIENYSTHIEKVDKSVENLKQYALDNMIGIQDAASRLIVDSLIKTSVGKRKPLTEVQYKTLTKTIESHFDHFTTLQAEYETKFLQDSLFLSAEHTLLSGQTQSMLHLHLDKIEHEYSNITMWAAILTLVFLVFSFYSMFKLEEYIRKGKDGAEEIEKLRINGSNHIKDIEKSKNTILDNSQQAIQKYIAAAETKISNLEDQYKTKLTMVDSELAKRAREVIDNLQKSIQEENEKTISSILEKTVHQYGSVKGEFDSKYAEINSQINNLVSKLTMIEEAIESKSNIIKSE